MLFFVLCCVQPSFAGTATVRNGYVACADLPTLVLALKYIKEKKEISASDVQFRKCFRTEKLSGLPVEIIENKEGHSHLLLRSEKAGERDLDFWTQSGALTQAKPKKQRATSQ